MFRSLTIVRELVQSLAKVIFLFKHSVKLCHHIFCGDVAACHDMACMLLCRLILSVQQTARTPIHDMLPRPHIIYNDIILLNVLT